MLFKKMIEVTEVILNKIHTHPFNLELSQGILPKDKFIYYLKQDMLYLADFAKALALTGARLPNNQHAQQFIEFSYDAINAERQMHADYLKTHDPNKSIIEQNPICFMYTNYILKTASLATIEEAVASLIPCFWVYREVGSRIAKQQNSANPYHEWISLYSSTSFDLSVTSAINIMVELGQFASENTKEKMIAAFLRSTQLEWWFWNGAYYEEKWLV